MCKFKFPASANKDKNYRQERTKDKNLCLRSTRRCCLTRTVSIKKERKDGKERKMSLSHHKLCH